jgi:hypothetical protein
MNAIQILTLIFDLPIKFGEIKLFRGAVIAALASDNLLFHNHIDDSLRYSYPLIQYKRIGGNAAIICIGEGTEVIGNFFDSQVQRIMLGEREVELKLKDVIGGEFNLTPTLLPHTYILKGWLPLNGENYNTYKGLTGVVERVQMLERILVGNILSMGKGLGHRWDDTISCKIVDIIRTHPVRNKGIVLLGFDIVWQCNLKLPIGIGLGKNSSIGSGVVFKVNPMQGCPNLKVEM